MAVGIQTRQNFNSGPHIMCTQQQWQHTCKKRQYDDDEAKDKETQAKREDNIIVDKVNLICGIKATDYVVVVIIAAQQWHNIDE